MKHESPAPADDGATSDPSDATPVRKPHNSNEPWPMPPRLEMFADVQARVVWPAINALSEASKHDILRELQLLLAVPQYRDTVDRVRRARAVAALREAHDLLFEAHVAQMPEGATRPAQHEVPLTVDEFRKLAVIHTARGWPALSSIVAQLGGSWSAALRASHLPSAPGGDAIRVGNGERFTAEEVTAALRECASDQDHLPSITEYRRWANSPEVLLRHGRRPRSQEPMIRYFSSWNEALRAAELVEDGAVGPRQRAGSFRPDRTQYSREQLREGLREVARFLGKTPRPFEYNRFRREQMDIELQRGAEFVQARAGYSVYNRIYETWDAAIVDAGLEPLGMVETTTGVRRVAREPIYLEQQLWDALMECADHYDGDAFTGRQYQEWRRLQDRTLPSCDVITARLRADFRIWPNIVEAALAHRALRDAQ